ncbi:MAG: 3-dehydroquinate synthase [Myxococcaceae bacterium]
MTVERIKVQAAAGEYGVEVGEGLLNDLGALLKNLGRRRKVALVCDERLRTQWAGAAEASLWAAGFDVTTLSVPSGEASKTLAQADALFTALIENGFSRSDTLVALGGGVVGDLAGFVAATFHRGVPWVQVPTTLLAQVDSSIGGKVAVDHKLGKNLIGAFHAPRHVVVDLATLSTLPVRERWCGLAEVVKAGFIADVSLLSLLERDLEALGSGTATMSTLQEVVARAIGIKAAVVNKDEREEGPRMWLNFGHTFGHALEAACGYGTLTHGEAVVCGMVAALELSVRLGALTRAEADRALALLARFPGQAVMPPSVTPASVKAALSRDKKVLEGQLRFVALRKLGQADIVQGLDAALVDEGVALTLAAAQRRTERT